MKPFAIVTAGAAALFAIGTVNVEPAKASSLTFDYNATVSITGNLNPLFEDLLEAFDIDWQSALNFSDTFSGTFSTLDDPAQYLDGDLNIEADFLSFLDNINGEAFAINQQNIFDLEFTGRGSIWSEVANAFTSFSFSYDRALNSILMTGFDTDIIAGCTSGSCETTALGDFILSTSFYGPTFTVADGNVEIAFSTDTEAAESSSDPTPVAESSSDPTPVAEPSSEPVSVPEPAMGLGLLGVGALMLKKKSSQQRCA